MDRRTLLKASFVPLGLSTLAGCGSGSSMAPIPLASGHNGSTASQTTLQVQNTLVPIYTTDVTRVAARPETILAIYAALAPGQNSDAVIQKALGAQFASLDSAGCFATYAAVFAGTVAPSGASPFAPLTASLQQLLASPALACGHYDKLTMLLALLAFPGLIPPDAAASDPPKPTMHIAVWLASAPINIGVHSQLVLSNVLDNAYLLLDPMYSFALRLPFSAGYPKASLTVLENATALLQAPAAIGDYVDMWPGNSAVNRTQLVQAMTSGVMGPQYIYHDSIYGSEGWDTHMATVIANMA
jgi:hypothetical protein